MTRFCKRCGQETERHKNGNCKLCGRAYYGANREKRRAYRRAYYVTNREKGLAAQRKYNTGWSPDRFEATLQFQRGRCAICEKSLEKARGRGCADHCHTTGKPRGILCGGCNTAMAAIDSPLLVRLLEYRNRWRDLHEQGLV